MYNLKPAKHMLLQQVPAMTALTFSAETTLKELNRFGEVSMRGLHQEAARLGLTVMGPVYWTYYGASGDPDQVFRLEVALPVGEPKGEPEGFAFRQLAPLKCVSQTLEGPWENLPGIYNRLIPQMLQHGYTLNGICRERYVHIDLAEPVNNITDVMIGVN